MMCYFYQQSHNIVHIEGNLDLTKDLQLFHLTQTAPVI